MDAQSPTTSNESHTSPARSRWKLWLILALVVGGVIAFFAIGAIFVADPSGRIRITEPDNGAVVQSASITIRGTSSPHWAGVYRVRDDRWEPVSVDEKGNWSYESSLVEGENVITFHLGSHYGQSDTVIVLYEP